MKRLMFLTVALSVAGMAYAIWPFYGLKQIGDAVRARDAQALTALVDRAAVKRSLTDQIALTYLRASGKDKGRTSIEIGLALQVAAAVADPQIEKLLMPENLFAMLSEGGTESYSGGAVGAPRLGLPSFANLARLVGKVEYSGRDFYISLPLRAEDQSTYRLKLTLTAWTWKLSGVTLPEQMQMRIAQEIGARAG